MKADEVKTIDDVHAFLIEQSMAGPREYTEAQATAIADNAVAIMRRNPDPEPLKVAQFIAGWEYARCQHER